MKKCCVVVPCYNEAGRLLTGEFADFVQANPFYHFLFVNDGSTDHTLQVLHEMCEKEERMEVLNLTHNCGKAAAVRAGMICALEIPDMEFVAFLDADLAIPLKELVRLVNYVSDSSSIQFGFLSKQPRKGSVRQPFKRYLMGRVLASMTQLSLKLQVYDTQCGCKVFHRSLIPAVTSEPFISPWLFDIEIFHRLIRSQGREWFVSGAVEMPLNELIERGGSRIGARALIQLPTELWTIHRTYSRQ